MTQNAKQHSTPEQAAPISEREIIEAAAAAAPVGKSTTTQKAQNIMEASVIQRKAVAEAFEAQKEAITGAVQEQRAMAMQQMAAEKKNYTAMEALRQKPTRETSTTASHIEPGPEQSAPATSASQQVASRATAAPKESDLTPTPLPELASSQIKIPASRTAVAQPAEPTPPAPTLTQAAGLNPPTIAGIAVAEKLAQTIRAIISQEINTQLKALLLAHTAGADTEAQAPE